MTARPPSPSHTRRNRPEIMTPPSYHRRGACRPGQEVIEIGEKVYSAQQGGIEPSSWESRRRTREIPKAPITTPQGGGFKSMNVTTRKTLGLYANVRPCVSLHPFVRTKHPKMDVVIVRENEEDLYAGIEHRQTDEVMQTSDDHRPEARKRSASLRYAIVPAARSHLLHEGQNHEAHGRPVSQGLRRARRWLSRY